MRRLVMLLLGIPLIAMQLTISAFILIVGCTAFYIGVEAHEIYISLFLYTIAATMTVMICVQLYALWKMFANVLFLVRHPHNEYYHIFDWRT